MTNTMGDLRMEVAKRLRDTLHGKQIDTIEKGVPEIEHMLGVVTLGAISTPKCEAGTILDPDHEFWQSYHEDVKTESSVRRKITTAMQSLNEDDLFRVSEPYGKDAGILYIEVEDIAGQSDDVVTSCAECGERIRTEPELVLKNNQYFGAFLLDCPYCDFEETVQVEMTRDE